MGSTTEERPNIRIEIHNNLVEEMEVDVENSAEEGEISDAKEDDDEIHPNTNNQISRRVSNIVTIAILLNLETGLR